MNDSLQRLRPREKPELPPRLIQQEMNPFKQLAFNRHFPLQRFVRCKGVFWDSVRMCTVVLDLGPVSGLISYRAASSVALANLSRGEGAAQCEISSISGEHRPQRSEDGAQPVIESGSYVIPGQSLTDENKC